MPTASPPTIVWNPWLRAAVSCAVVLHLVGVMVAPISTPPQFAGPPSIIGNELQKVYRPYITAMYLDHAYKFFAPNPGPSHLLRYDLYFADGRRSINSEDQIFPDRHRHWPRLLYHRHFMLTEFLNDGRPPEAWGDEPLPASPAAGPTASGEVLPPLAPQAEGRVETYLRGFAAYLLRRHGAERVELFYRIHRLPSPEEVLEGKSLDAPDTYLERRVLIYPAPAKSGEASRT